MPLRVVWARLPEGLRLAYEMNRLGERLSLNPEVPLLVKELVATINGCSFCQDIGRAQAPTDTLPRQKLDALLRYPSAPVFDDAERAALAYAEDVTRFLLGVAEQVPDGFEVSLVRVNGRPGLLATVDGAPQSVWAFDVRAGRIQNAYAILTPDKLRHVDPPRNSTRRAYDSLPGL